MKKGEPEQRLVSEPMRDDAIDLQKVAGLHAEHKSRQPDVPAGSSQQPASVFISAPGHSGQILCCKLSRIVCLPMAMPFPRKHRKRNSPQRSPQPFSLLTQF